MFFTKLEYKEIMLPFIYIDDPDDFESGIISIEAYGDIFGEKKYCYAGYTLKKHFVYDNGDYEQMIGLLKNSDDKKIKVRLKIKRDKPKDFRIDIDSISAVYNDDRFKFLELVGWGFNDKSFEKLRKH